MSRIDRDVPVYPIGVVQKLTGLSGRQIRYYEKVGLLAPHRTSGNQRLYSPEDVDLLLQVKTFLAEGLNIQGVKARLAETAGARPENKGKNEEEPFFPEIDHDHVIRRLRAGTKLSSLFPVNNQAELARYLQFRRSEDEDDV